MHKLFTKVLSVLSAVSLFAGMMPISAQAASRYTITFDTNGGYLYNNTGMTHYNSISYTDTDGDGKVTVTYPFTYDKMAYSVKKPGYTLSGWSSGSGTISIGSTKTFTLDGDITYKAVWTGDKHNVTFVASNGTTVLGTKELQVGGNQAMSLSALKLSYTPTAGDIFTGWDYTDSNGNTTYFDGYNSDAVYDFIDSSGNPIFDQKNVTLVARTIPITAKSITVSYNANGGGGTTMPASTFEYGNVVKLSKSQYGRNGYLFAGWALSPTAKKADFEDGQNSEVNFGLFTNTTLYAVWTAKDAPTTASYTASFVKNVIQTASGTTTYTNAPNITLTKNAEKLYNNSVSGLQHNTLYQQGYYVSGFKIAKIGSDGSIVKQSTEYAAGAYFSVNENGYLVITDNTKTYLEKISDYTDSTTIYIVPQWTPVTVKLSYAPNAGATGTAPDSVFFSVDKNITLAENTFSHATKSFMGWSMDSTATADNMYTPGATASRSMTYPAGYHVRSSKNSLQTYNLFSDPFSKFLDIKNWSSDFTTSTFFDTSTGILDLTSLSSYKIYAIWDDNTYTVEFNANAGGKQGVSGRMDDQHINVTSPTALTSNGFAITGYNFTGWNLAADGSSTAFKDQEVVKGLAKRNATVKLYAQWEVAKVDTVPLIVSQDWDDANNQDGVRPAKVTYVLSATADGKTLKPSDINLTSFEFEVNSTESSSSVARIPLKYLSDKGTYQNIVYQMTAATITGYSYTTSITSTSENVTTSFKFSHTPATVSHSVTIKMSDSDNQDGMRPKTTELTIKGSDGSTKTVTVNITGATQNYTFENLPVYSKGTAVTYTVTLSNVNGYTTTSSATKTSTTFTCSHTPEITSTSIHVVWKDDDNKGNTRPTNLKTVLQLSSGKSMNASISAVSNQTTLNNIPKYHNGSLVTGTVSVTAAKGYTSEVSGSLSSGFTVTMTLTDIAKQNIDTQKTATAATKSAKDASTKLDESDDKTITKPSTKTTNAKVNKDLRTIVVRTIWNDNQSDFLRPLALKITLIGSDGSSYDQVLTNNTGWTTTFSEVPSRDVDSGEDITYQIKYAPINGYTTHVYHTRSNPNEFIMEHFLPGTDTPAQPLVPQTVAQEVEAGNKLVVGGTLNDPALQANEDGSPVTDEPAPTDIFSDPVYKPTWSKYLIPLALGCGLFTMVIAIIIMLRNSRK